MEAIFRNFPLKINPFRAILIAWLMAYVPHIYKSVLVKKRAAELGKSKGLNDSIANSKAYSTQFADSSPVGLKIAQLKGCHTNCMEALSYFAAAITSAFVAKVDSNVLQGAAAMFLVTRVAYIVVYSTKLNGIMRTAMWAIGVFICVQLLSLAAENLVN